MDRIEPIKRFTRSPRLLGATLIASILGLGVAWTTISWLSYRATVKQGETKHVIKLINLPEAPESADQGIKELQRFRSGNWRFFLTRESLDKINQKSTRLHRAIEVDRLKRFADSSLLVPIDEKNVDHAFSRLSAAFGATGFKFLSPSERNAVTSRLELATALRNKLIQMKAESQKKAKEALAQAKRAKESEERISFLEHLVDQKRGEGLTDQQIRNQFLEGSFLPGMVGTTDQERRLALQRRLGGSSGAPQEVSAESSASTGNPGNYQIGPRGGCFYWSGSDKVYVDRSYCGQ